MKCYIALGLLVSCALAEVILPVEIAVSNRVFCCLLIAITVQFQIHSQMSLGLHYSIENIFYLTSVPVRSMTFFKLDDLAATSTL